MGSWQIGIGSRGSVEFRECRRRWGSSADGEGDSVVP